MCPLLYRNSKDANINLDNSLLQSCLQKTQVMADFSCQSFPSDTKEKEAKLSKTDFNLSKKMKATLTCITIRYNLASLVNAFLIPLMVDYLSRQVTWRVVVSRQANLRGSSNSCTTKPTDRRIELNQTTKAWRLNSTSPIEDIQGTSDKKKWRHTEPDPSLVV
jgi:hypothetical protein